MAQNQEWIENNFHGKRVMYGGFALLDHSLLGTHNAKTLWFLKFIWFIIAFCPLTNLRDSIVHLAGIDSLNLPFLLAHGFKLYQIAG